MHHTATRICQKLQKNGYEALFAGGAVRDMLMKKDPHDIDIATNARPEEIESLFEKSFAIGKHFGVITILEDEYQFEIATFRNDSAEGDGRRPDAVFFTNKKEDALRRDFTINAIFYDPIAKTFFDFTGGKEDIQKKRICFVGNAQKRIEEDHLRILRCIRFRNRLQFSYEENTKKALQKNITLLQKISPNRIREEISKMLIDKNRTHALRDLRQLGILEEILPEFLPMMSVEDGQKGQTVWEHTIRVLSYLENPNTELVWAALLHDTGKPETCVPKKDRNHFPHHQDFSAKIAQKIGKRLNFSNFSRQKIAWLCKYHIRFYDTLKMNRSHKLHFFDHVFFRDLIALCRADALGSDGNPDLVNQIEAEYHDCLENKVLPQFHADLLDGREIGKILGIEQGKEIGEIKTKLRFEQMEGSIQNKTEAKKWVQENMLQFKK